jgi:transcriptional regulator with XRE-family HTH domain
MAKRSGTQTASQGSRCLGVVSGYVLKLCRQSAGVTQERLAELLELDVSTVQGWESGRRPLTALPMRELMRLRMHLTQQGAPPSMARHLSDALEADILLATAVDFGASWPGRDPHPLAASVQRHSLINLVTWPITGQTPPQLAHLAPRHTPRGPTATHPTLYADERQRFFDHLLAVAESGAHAGDPLLRRQAVYLLGFDTRPAVTAWLRDEWQRVTHRQSKEGIAAQLDVRTASVALASNGDGESLHNFVANLSSHRHDTVNLNYWAYWIGEIADEQPNDDFMLTTDPRSWGGVRLLEHLARRLDPDSPHLPLNLHTLHSLVASRPALLTDSGYVRTLIAKALDLVGSRDGLGATVRDQLAGLAYAVRIADR